MLVFYKLDRLEMSSGLGDDVTLFISSMYLNPLSTEEVHQKKDLDAKHGFKAMNEKILLNLREVRDELERQRKRKDKNKVYIHIYIYECGIHNI